jgi:hypothetical protein
MPKKIVKPKSKATIKNKNKNKINIKININSNNKKKGNKLVKQQTIPSQPNFQNPIVHIQPVAPLQNNNSLIDNQFGIGITKQINSLEGEVNRLKIQKDEAIHFLNNERLQRDQLADLVENRLNELKTKQQFEQPTKHPMDDNNSYNTPDSTPYIRPIQRIIKPEKIINLQPLGDFKDNPYIDTPTPSPKDKLIDLANKARIKENMIEASTKEYKIHNKPSKLQELANKYRIKTNIDDAVIYQKNSKRNKKDYELRRLKENITDKNKNPKNATRRRSSSE